MLSRLSSFLTTAALLVLVDAANSNSPPLPTKLDNGMACQYYMSEYDCYRTISRLSMDQARQFDTGPLRMSSGADAGRQALFRQLDVKLKPRSIYVLAASGDYRDCGFYMQLADGQFNPSASDATRNFAIPADLGNDDLLPTPTHISNNQNNYRANFFANLLVESKKVKGCFNEEVPTMPRASWPGDDRPDATASFFMKNNKFVTPTSKATVSTAGFLSDLPTLTPDGAVAASQLGQSAAATPSNPPDSVPDSIPGDNHHH